VYIYISNVMQHRHSCILINTVRNITSTITLTLSELLFNVSYRLSVSICVYGKMYCVVTYRTRCFYDRVASQIGSVLNLPPLGRSRVKRDDQCYCYTYRYKMQIIMSTDNFAPIPTAPEYNI